MIKQEGGKWVLYSKDGKKKLGGPYDTEDEAKMRERQVQHFKQQHMQEALAMMAGGKLSQEAMIAACQCALDEAWAAAHPNPPGGYAPMCPNRIMATFDDAFVYRDDMDRLWKQGFTRSGTSVKLAGDPVEQVLEIEDSPEGGLDEATGAGQGTGKVLAESQVLCEAGPAGSLKGHLNRALSIIEGTTMIGAQSVNGPNKKRRYTDKALAAIAQMAEGLPAYANHVAPELAFKPRDVRDLIGRHRNVRFDRSQGKVISDLHVLPSQANWVFPLAEQLGDRIGNSLVSRGLVRMEGDTEVVDEIERLRSCDLVSDPATTKGLFESADEDAPQIDVGVFRALAEVGGTVRTLLFDKAGWPNAEAAQAWAQARGFRATLVEAGAAEYRLPQRPAGRGEKARTVKITDKVSAVVVATQQEGRMALELTDILQHLKDNTDHGKVVAETMGFVPKAEHAKLQESVAGLTEKAQAGDKAVAELAEAKAEITTLKGKVDKHDAAEALSKKRTSIQEAIDKHELGKSYGKVAGAVSDHLRTMMEQAEETQWGAILDDRVAALKAVPGGQGQRPSSVLREAREGADDGRLPAGIHQRAAAALRS